MTKNNSSGQPPAGIIILICMIIVCGFSFYALINREPDQREEDCSKVEVFDAQKKRCRDMTGREYAQKWAESDEANIKYGREHATVCTPAEKITSMHEGKYILACYTVRHIYDTGKGTVFLNSNGEIGDFLQCLSDITLYDTRMLKDILANILGYMVRSRIMRGSAK
jgi:hypothetical protein